MKINRIRTLVGPNVYSYQPALVMRLELEAADEKNSSENSDFSSRIENMLTSAETSNGQMRQIRRADNRLAEAVKNVALDLLKFAGFGAPGGSVRFSGEPRIYEIAVEYKDERAARVLVETAVEAVEAILKSEPFEIVGKIAEAKAIAAENDARFAAASSEAPDADEQKSKIPIVAVTGTNGKTTVARLISHVLLATGRNVGTTTTDGILLNGETVQTGDTTGPASARKILENAAVDVAVLETARGGIMRRGLGWNWADIAVITNIGEDHIGQDGIESVADLVNVKSLVAERVRADGTLVLNADDDESAALINRPAVKEINRKIVYYALSEENPIIKKHSDAGETVYFVRGGWICERRADENLPIVETTKIPIAMNGTADFQIQNAMASIAAARALAVSPETIAGALLTFAGARQNPGRNNLYRVGAGYALIDYGHNADGFAAVSRTARRWTGKTVTAIISLPGDRDNRIIEAAARIAARGFDRVIISEEANRRGRAAGEMAKLMRDAIEREKPGAKCEIVLDEIEAFSSALAKMKKNEVVVMFYRQLDLILEILASNRAVPVSSFGETNGAD